MSTRGAIARVRGDGWEGVYQHSDSYLRPPHGLGPRLWRQLWDVYGGDLNMLLANAIDLHPGGWSFYPESCYCHDPRWAARDGSLAKDSPYYTPKGPNGRMTDRTADPIFIEYAYAFSLQHRMMTIFYNTVVRKLVPGQHGSFVETWRMGQWNSPKVEVHPAHYCIFRPFQVYPVDGPEPPWNEIQDAIGSLRERDRALLPPVGIEYEKNPLLVPRLIRFRRWMP